MPSSLKVTPAASGAPNVSNILLHIFFVPGIMLLIKKVHIIP